MNFDKIEEQLSDRLKDAAGITAKQESSQVINEGILFKSIVPDDINKLLDKDGSLIYGREAFHYNDINGMMVTGFIGSGKSEFGMRIAESYNTNLVEMLPVLLNGGVPDKELYSFPLLREFFKTSAGRQFRRSESDTVMYDAANYITDFYITFYEFVSKYLPTHRKERYVFEDRYIMAANIEPFSFIKYTGIAVVVLGASWTKSIRRAYGRDGAGVAGRLFAPLMVNSPDLDRWALTRMVESKPSWDAAIKLANNIVMKQNARQESDQSVNDIIDQHFLEMKDQAIDNDPDKDLIAEDDDLVQEANHLKIAAKHIWDLAADAGMFWVKAFKDIFGIKRSRSVTPKAVIREKPVRESIMAQYQAIYPELLKIVDQNIIIRPVFNFKDHTSSLNINFINGTTNYITIADYSLWQHPAIGPSKEYDSSLTGVFTGGNVSEDIRTVTNNPMYVKALQKFYNTTKAIIEKAGIGEVGWETFDGITGRLVIKVPEQKIQKMVNDYYSKVQEASIDSIVEGLAEPFGSDDLSKAKIKNILETVQKSVSDRNFVEQPMSEIELDGAKEWLRMAINHLIPRLDEYLKDPDKAEFFSTCLDDADEYIDHLRPDPNYIAVPVLKYRSASVVNHSLIKDLFNTSLQSIAKSTGFGYLSADSIEEYHEDGDIYFVPDIDKFTAYISQYHIFHPSQDMNMADPDISIEDQMARVNEAFDMVFSESVFVSKDDIFYHKDEFKSGEINICFVVGLKGSGKSSTAASMARNMDNTEHYDLKYIVNNNGRDMSFYSDKGDLAVEFFRGPGAKYYGEFNELKEELKISEDTIADKITNAFVDFAIRYANHHKDQRFIIDGSQLHQYIEPARFRDYAVLIKGTSIVKSMYQNSKKDGEGIGSTLAKTHQYAGDEFKLLKWRNMYKGYIKKDPEYKDDDYEPKKNDTKPANVTHKHSNDEPEWEFDEVYNIGLRDNYYLIAEAYNAYVMDLKNNEYLIKSALSSLMNEQVLQEADLSRTQFDAKWNKFMTFVDSMIGRFGKVMDKVIGNNRGYLEKHKDIILNQKWGDQEYSHLGDYKLAQQRITNTKIPEFNYATFREPLRQEGFDAALKQFMTGHTDFKYDPNEKNLAVQFKKYFLALNKGETKGKLSDLNPQELYNYCYNYQDIRASIQRDREALNRSSKMILQAIERETRRAGENVNANNAEPGGKVEPTVSTKEQTITENTKLTEDRSLWQSLTEADAPKTATAPATAKQATTSLTNNAPKTNEVGKTNNNQVKTDLKVENDKSKKNVKTPDEEIAMMSNKWITMCRAYCAGKMTAIQQISKDYMALIKNHVTSYTNAQAGGTAQDTGTAQPQQAQQQQPDQNAKAGQNWLKR